MTTIAELDRHITNLTAQAHAMRAGDALRRTHYTQAMGGQRWKTLTRYLLDLQGGMCALTGHNLSLSRGNEAMSATLHLLVPSIEWGTDKDRAATTASNGKSLDPYRFGFVEGNVVVASTAASQLVRSQTATARLLDMEPDDVAMQWTPEMLRPAKVDSRDEWQSLARDLFGRGWLVDA